MTKKHNYRMPTLLSVAALGIALAVFYLFMTQVEYNLSYNRNFDNSERLFRIGVENTAEGTGNIVFFPRCFEAEWTNIPHVEAITSKYFIASEEEFKVGENTFATKQNKVSKNFPDVFSMHPIYGSLKSFSKSQAIITRSEALRMFGVENAVGKTLATNQKDTPLITICAVVDDMPENCSFNNGVFCSLEETDLDNMRRDEYFIYVKLDDVANTDKVREVLQRRFVNVAKTQMELDEDMEKQFVANLTTIHDTYFSGEDFDEKGSRSMQNTLLAGAIFVIIIALLNFVNFTLAQTPVKMREINTRKVLGESNNSLRFRIIKGNVGYAIIAILLAAFMASVAAESEWLQGIMLGNMSLESHVSLCVLTVFAGLVIGILSAIYPAFYSTCFAPSLVLRGSFALSGMGRMLRSIMLGVQFVIAFVFTTYSIIMSLQSYYIFNTDYGYDKELVVSCQLGRNLMPQKAAIKQEIMKLPFVESATCALSVPALGDAFGWRKGDEDHAVNFRMIPVDKDYMRTIGMKITEGRDFNDADKHGAAIVTKSMMKCHPWLRMGLPLSYQSSAWDIANYNIVGTVDDVPLGDMHRGNKDVSLAFLIMGDDAKDWPDHCRTLVVRLSANCNKREAKEELQAFMKRFDRDANCHFMFLDDKIEQIYKEDLRAITQIKTFAAVCILITLLGVLCLTMFETEYRRKEVAIRKIMGSGTRNVVLLFTRRYVLPLLLAFVVASPMAYLLGKKWLEGFAEHTEMYWWIFPLALLLVSIVVIITVVAQCWRVASSNPIESVKTE